MDSLATLHDTILACRLCEQAGYLNRAAPVVCEPVPGRIMLIGQAPGRVELERRRPFQGKAGRILFGWMQSIGIEEEEFRRHVYMTAITKCFPGPARSGSGDRRPSASEVVLCRPFLERQLEVIRPEVILLVGSLAIERYFPRTQLTELVGQQFERDGTLLIPLPHPSGASRWLNDSAHRELLSHALDHVRATWEHIVISRPVAV